MTEQQINRTLSMLARLYGEQIGLDQAMVKIGGKNEREN